MKDKLLTIVALLAFLAGCSKEFVRYDGVDFRSDSQKADSSGDQHGSPLERITITKWGRTISRAPFVTYNNGRISREELDSGEWLDLGEIFFVEKHTGDYIVINRGKQTPRGYSITTHITPKSVGVIEQGGYIPLEELVSDSWKCCTADHYLHIESGALITLNTAKHISEVDTPNSTGLIEKGSYISLDNLNDETKWIYLGRETGTPNILTLPTYASVDGKIVIQVTGFYRIHMVAETGR